MPQKKTVAKFRTWACQCGVRYSVEANDVGRGALPDRFRCWATRCRFYMVRNDKLKPGQVVTAMALFQASTLGSEMQRKCSPSDIRKLALGKKVVAIAVEPSPAAGRSLISSITLEDGNTIHLTTSTKGVTIYKVTHE